MFQSSHNRREFRPVQMCRTARPHSSQESLILACSGITAANSFINRRGIYLKAAQEVKSGMFCVLNANLFPAGFKIIAHFTAAYKNRDFLRSVSVIYGVEGVRFPAQPARISAPFSDKRQEQTLELSAGFPLHSGSRIRDSDTGIQWLLYPKQDTCITSYPLYYRPVYFNKLSSYVMSFMLYYSQAFYFSLFTFSVHSFLFCML